MEKKYISIDIGGTAIKYGILTEEGAILERYEMATEAYKGGPEILKKAEGIVEGFLDSGKVLKEELLGICISTAGMETRFHVPCEVENDVNCAGLAEYMSGASKGSKSALMLTIGTGIGGSMVIGGEVYHGCSGSACEVGYMHMEGSDFQTLGAASILTRKVAEWKNEPEENWNGYHIFEEAKKGDELCIRAIDEMADVLGRGIANICYVMNPEVVVLGGGVMAQEEYLRGRIETALRKYLVPSIAKHTKLAFAKHRNDAGMLGAYYHFQNMHRK